jgi:serine/threonine protein kinase
LAELDTTLQTFGADGRYVIQRELGRGTMGVVYEAEDMALGRTVALKTIELAFEPAAAARAEFEQRFFIEARVAAKLSHPGIVVCHDVGKDPATGKLFIVFEHLKGRTLAQRMADGPIEWREALRIVAQAARAMHHAHEQGIIHRDLKPANLMLTEPGSQVKIMDFGVAKVESLRGQLTAAGQSFGSPLYMSPEQALGEWSDARSDIFSLGSILCTLLLHRPWFDAARLPDILQRVVHDEAPVVSRLVPGLPMALDSIVARALAKRAEERYVTAAAMAEDLEDVIASRPPRHALSEFDVDDDPLSHLVTPIPGTMGGAEPPTPGNHERAGLLKEAPAASTAPQGAETLELGTKRKPRFGAIAAGLLMVLLVSVGVMSLGGAFLLRRASRSAPTPVATTSEATSVPSVAPDAAPTAESTVVVTESVPGTLPPVSAKTDAPAPSVAPAVERERAAATAAPTHAPAQGHIHLVVEHPIEQGRMVVWLDGVVALETKLRAEVSKKLVALRVHKGHLEQTLDVEPGRHEIKVEVTWNESRRTETQVADVTDGQTGLLSVRVGGLTNDMSLDWSPTDPGSKHP